MDCKCKHIQIKPSQDVTWKTSLLWENNLTPCRWSGANSEISWSTTGEIRNRRIHTSILHQYQHKLALPRCRRVLFWWSRAESYRCFREPCDNIVKLELGRAISKEISRVSKSIFSRRLGTARSFPRRMLTLNQVERRKQIHGISWYGWKHRCSIRWAISTVSFAWWWGISQYFMDEWIAKYNLNKARKI